MPELPSPETHPPGATDEAASREAPLAPAPPADPTMTVDDLLAILRRDTRRRRVLDRAQRALMLGILFALPLVYVVVSLVSGHWGPFPFRAFQWINVVNVGAWVVAARLRDRAAPALARTDDLRVVGPLAEVVGSSRDRFAFPQESRDLAEEALVRLLPRLRPEDSALLTDTQRACLTAALSRENRALARAIVGALGQVGDGRALPAVELLAGGKGAAAEDPGLRQAAETLVPVLQERQRRAEQAVRLLRPAQSPDAPAETLLRPAQGAHDADEHVLVRPAQPDEQP